MMHAIARAASPEETRRRILSAAREVIARKGKRGATTREIADVAGVNEATLFRHFGAKETLILAVAQQYCISVELRDLTACLQGDLAEDLLTIGRFMLDHLTSQWDMIRCTLVDTEFDESVFAATVWRPQFAILDVIVELLSPRVAAGELRGNPKKTGLLFLGMVFMHVLGRSKFKDSPLCGGGDDEALRYIIDVLLYGVRNT
jgi:AcrR family transcriptional regulator